MWLQLLNYSVSHPDVSKNVLASLLAEQAQQLAANDTQVKELQQEASGLRQAVEAQQGQLAACMAQLAALAAVGGVCLGAIGLIRLWVCVVAALSDGICYGWKGVTTGGTPGCVHRVIAAV